MLANIHLNSCKVSRHTKRSQLFQFRPELILNPSKQKKKRKTMHKWNKIFRINKTLPQKFVSWYIFSPTVLLLILSSMRKNRKRLLHIFIKCHKKPYFGNCFSFLWAKTQCVSFFFKHFFLYVEKKFELYGNGTGEIVVYLKNRFHNFWRADRRIQRLEFYWRWGLSLTLCSIQSFIKVTLMFTQP